MKKILLYILIAFLLIPSGALFAYRLHTIGFELQSLTAGEDFTSAGCGGGWCFINTTATTSAVHSGSASFYSHPTTAANSWIGNVFRADGSTATSSARCYFYYEQNTATNPIEMCAFWDSVAANRRAAVVLTSGGVGQLLTDNNSQIGSNSSALSANTWYCVQIKAEGVGANSYLAGSIEAGECTSSPSLFAETYTTTIADFNAVYIGTPNATAVYGAYWDDLAVNDDATTNGSTQVGFPGGGKIVYLQPNASGDNTPDGCNNTNPCGTPANAYQEVDETNPDDATSFIDLDSATSMAYFNITNTSGLIDSYDTITLVDSGIRLREEASAVTVFQFGVKSQASGKVASSTANDAGDTTWRTNQTGTTAMTNRMSTTTEPQALGAWTTTLLDSAQIGVGSTDADDIDISTLWLEVEYVDGSAPPAGSAVVQSEFFFE